ncbi:MAG TPA: VIT domain-containing protein [Pyrinomonadaceae bacterium]
MRTLPWAEVDEIKTGTLVVTGAPEASPLPLESMDVIAQITGPLVSVTVTQLFGNPFNEPVELSYLFPLPHEAAVFDFELRVGDTMITASVEELEAARRAYEEARDRGRLASLLEQKRLSLFSLDLANVRPGESVRATLRYQERLRYDDGRYSFIFRMGVTPRYSRTPEQAQGADAPVSPQGAPAPSVDISVSVDVGAEIGDIKAFESPSHPVEVTRLDERRAQLRLAGDHVPNKDFVLRYPVAGEEVGARAWLSASPAGAKLLATLVPPAIADVAEPPPREFVFVLDRSGSMTGGPLAEAKNALRACLRTLGERDSFALLAFDDRLEWLHEGAIPFTQKSVDDADRWLDRLDARGGTEIAGALGAALSLPTDPERRRYVVFLTDGAVHDEAGTLEVVRKSLGRARLFAFGLGPSVNRGLLAKAAEAGRGTAEFLQLGEDVEGAIIRFQDRVSYTVLTDLRLEWEGVKAWDVYPRSLPDLYAGQPLEVVACASHDGSAAEGSLTLIGDRGGEEVRARVALPRPGGRDGAVERAWARARVDDLLAQGSESARNLPGAREQVIALAVEHRLVTTYTALVAVDADGEARGDGRPRQVAVSQPLPEGVIMGAAPPVMASMPMFRSNAPAPTSAESVRSIFGVFRRKRPSAEAYQNAEPEQSPSSSYEEANLYQASPTSSAETTKATSSDPERALRELARTQNASGSWGAGDVEVEFTAAAVLAFVRNGHTRRSGHFRRQVSKAVQWLQARGDAEDLAAGARSLAIAVVEAAEAGTVPPNPGSGAGDVALSEGQIRARITELRDSGAHPALMAAWGQAIGAPPLSG